ncbi:MAG: hypothetical protein EHM24_27165, partial [Acidobacteria bacterium]
MLPTPMPSTCGHWIAGASATSFGTGGAAGFRGAGFAAGFRAGELDMARDLLPQDLEEMLRVQRPGVGLLE